MALALKEPDLVANLIAVDNAPIDVRLESDFARYIQGMKKIDEADVTRQVDADKILEPYEKVTPRLCQASSLPCVLQLADHLRDSP